MTLWQAPESMQPAEEIPQALPLPRALILLFVTFLVILAAGLVGMLLGGRSEILLSEALVIVPAWLYVKTTGWDWRRVFRVQSVPGAALLASLAVGLGAALIGHELDLFVQELFPMPEPLAEGIEAMLRAKSLADGVILVIAVVFLAGILEEMLFRGMLLGSLEATFDVTRAVLFCALLFALFHMNPWTAVQILVFGVVLGVLAWKSQSIWPAALVHAINNGFEFAVLNVGKENLRFLFFKEHVSPAFLLLAGALVYYGFKRFYAAFERPGSRTESTHPWQET